MNEIKLDLHLSGKTAAIFVDKQDRIVDWIGPFLKDNKIHLPIEQLEILTGNDHLISVYQSFEDADLKNGDAIFIYTVPQAEDTGRNSFSNESIDAPEGPGITKNEIPDSEEPSPGSWVNAEPTQDQSQEQPIGRTTIPASSKRPGKQIVTFIALLAAMTGGIVYYITTDSEGDEKPWEGYVMPSLAGAHDDNTKERPLTAPSENTNVPTHAATSSKRVQAMMTLEECLSQIANPEISYNSKKRFKNMALEYFLSQDVPVRKMIGSQITDDGSIISDYIESLSITCKQISIIKKTYTAGKIAEIYIAEQ